MKKTFRRVGRRLGKTQPMTASNPIIYANEGFERLTGYAKNEVVGRNCRFLQGPNTDPDAVRTIRNSLAKGTECTVQLLNYRKDGTPFWNRLSITPLRNKRGEITHFVGIQSDVTAQKEAEESLRIANDRISADLAAAAKIQRSLLPAKLPDIPGLRLSWSYRPCGELGGDTLNVFRLDENHLGLYVLDVSGHGVAAALSAVTLSRLLSATPGQVCLPRPAEGSSGYHIASPAEVAEKLNQQFQLDAKVSQYFTLVYAVLDVGARSLRFVSAGHPGPIHVTAGEESRPLPSTGPPIGLLPEASFEEHELALKPRDRVFFYTDGVTESSNQQGDQFGEERFLKLIQSSVSTPIEQSLNQITIGLEKWAENTPLDDDVSLLAFELLPLDKPND
jgi:PAS domain S-box-containing protein